MAEPREPMPVEDRQRKNPDPVVGGPAAAIPPEQLVTMPSGPPAVPNEPETPEAKEFREAQGLPPPPPFKLPEPPGGEAGDRHRTERERQHAEAERRAEQAKAARK